MTPTPIQIANGLLGIHHHDLEDNVIYKEEELLPLLKKWGLEPDWEGNARELHKFTEKLQEIYLISAPGAHIKETMEHIGMTEAELAEKLGIDQQQLQDLFVGLLRVPGFAERLEEIFGIDRIFWVNLQRNYDKAIAAVAQKEAQTEMNNEQG